MATLKIVKKWENIFSCELVKVIGGKAVKLTCKTCRKFENRITSIEGFSPNWIVGTSSVKKDSLQKFNTIQKSYSWFKRRWRQRQYRGA